tara:strand:- start:20 stop:700 length:681 start_codon:yes stop_codon:yes gene_type:complete
MKAIISDIHANYEALCATLNAIDSMNIQDIVCLGDISGYYCDINECCNLIREKNIPSLLGNHDYYLISGEQCNRSNSVNRCIKYQRQIITSENLNWLQTLTPNQKFGELNAVHGGWKDSLEEYVKMPHLSFLDQTGKYFISGHTHVPCIYEREKKVYCNPGSVGQPRDGDSRASFATFDGVTFKIHRVKYNIQKTQERMKMAGFSPYFYENLSNGTRIGGKIDTFI